MDDFPDEFLEITRVFKNVFIFSRLLLSAGKGSVLILVIELSVKYSGWCRAHKDRDK